jgi:hypothetical protein
MLSVDSVQIWWNLFLALIISDNAFEHIKCDPLRHLPTDFGLAIILIVLYLTFNLGIIVHVINELTCVFIIAMKSEMWSGGTTAPSPFHFISGFIILY